MGMNTKVYLQLYVFNIYITLTSMSLLPIEINSISLRLINIINHLAISESVPHMIRLMSEVNYFNRVFCFHVRI